MESISESILRLRVVQGIKATQHGQRIVGTHFKVFVLKDFGDVYCVFITQKSSNDTYCTEMKDDTVNTFFRDLFYDDLRFLASKAFLDFRFEWVGNDL